MDEIIMTVSKVKGAEDLPLPKYMTSLSAGMDLSANVVSTVVLGPGEYKMIPCGIKIQLPEGFEAQVRPQKWSC